VAVTGGEGGCSGVANTRGTLDPKKEIGTDPDSPRSAHAVASSEGKPSACMVSPATSASWMVSISKSVETTTEPGDTPVTSQPRTPMSAATVALQ